MGFLVLALSFSLLLAFEQPAAAQFPIRQIPRTWGPQQPVFQQSAASRNATEGVPYSAGGNATEGVPYNAGGVPYGAVPSQPAQQSPATPPHPAIARIVVPERDGISYGSGTLVDARGQFGLVVTNWHVVRDAAGPVSVQFADGFRSPAEIVKTDKDWDLAALSVHRPKAAPIPVTGTAPQPGESLTIAGYGGGDYRIASGKCTQYLAPGVNFPHEMIELSTEARQGDSGGPILNERGELAGVLFGSGPGYTSGSYGGRVLQFLASVVPGGTPGSDGGAPTSNIASQPATNVPANTVPGNSLAGNIWAPPAQVQDNLNWLTQNHQPPAAGVITPPPQATALHESNATVPPQSVYRREVAPEDSPLTPAQPQVDDGLLSVPELGGVTGHGQDLGELDDEVDPKAEVHLDRLASNTRPGDLSPSSEATEAAAARVGVVHSPLPPRVGVPDQRGAGVSVSEASSDQILLTLWHRYGGTSLADQAKSVMAIIGFLSLLIVFLRINRHKEPEADVD